MLTFSLVSCVTGPAKFGTSDVNRAAGTVTITWDGKHPNKLTHHEIIDMKTKASTRCQIFGYDDALSLDFVNSVCTFDMGEYGCWGYQHSIKFQCT